MKIKEQQYEKYRLYGGELEFHDWIINNENGHLDYTTTEELKEIVDKNLGFKNQHEAYKKGKRNVLSETILSLLVDMRKERIEGFLENSTPEELVDWCKQIYDREFDINVDTYGVVGADEIGWEEALAIFKENFDTE